MTVAGGIALIAFGVIYPLTPVWCNLCPPPDQIYWMRHTLPTIAIVAGLATIVAGVVWYLQVRNETDEELTNEDVGPQTWPTDSFRRIEGRNVNTILKTVHIRCNLLKLKDEIPP